MVLGEVLGSAGRRNAERIRSAGLPNTRYVDLHLSLAHQGAMSTYRADDEQSLLEIRKTIITAIASDDELLDIFVLKGGNALDIVYKLGERSSLDVDLSMAGDFSDELEQARIRNRLFSALRDRFDAKGFVLFDEKFETRPQRGGGPGVIWGGYNALFKLIRRSRFVELGGIVGTEPSGRVLDAMRREASVTGPSSHRVFTIEISKFEHVAGKQLAEVDGFDCYVYTPAMIAAEKLRALCQQLPEYPLRAHPTPRARDFFDIHTVSTQAGCDISAPENLELVRAVFAAKQVDLKLLNLLSSNVNREFHREAWPAVQNAVRSGPPESFDFYFDFVSAEVRKLIEALESSDRQL